MFDNKSSTCLQQIWNQFMWKNVENSSWLRGLVSPNSLLFITLDSRVSLITGTSPAARVQQEPSGPDWLTSGHVWQTKRKGRPRWWRQLGFMWTHGEGIVWPCKYQKKKKKGICKKRVLCFSFGKGGQLFLLLPFTITIPEQSAKAAALIEETVTSCDAAAYTWHPSITILLHSTRCPNLDTQALIASAHP